MFRVARYRVTSGKWVKQFDRLVCVTKINRNRGTYDGNFCFGNGIPDFRLLPEYEIKNTTTFLKQASYGFSPKACFGEL